MVMVTNPALHLLREGMKKVGMTQQELYDAYKARGGKAKQPGTLGSWLRGERDVPSLQLALLYTCLNERMAREGEELVELPFRFGLVEIDNQPKMGTAYSLDAKREAPEGASVNPDSPDAGEERQMS